MLLQPFLRKALMNGSSVDHDAHTFSLGMYRKKQQERSNRSICNQTTSRNDWFSTILRPVNYKHVMSSWNAVHHFTFKTLIHCFCHTSVYAGRGFEGNKVEWTKKVESRKTQFPTASEACKALTYSRLKRGNLWQLWVPSRGNLIISAVPHCRQKRNK